MSVKDTVTCRAKDPATCRFHGTADVKTIADLEAEARDAARDGDNSKYYKLRDEIRERQIEETEMKRAAWSDTDKIVAAETFFRALSESERKATEIDPDNYEIDNTDDIQKIADKLEDEEVEIEINHPVSGYDIIRELYIPILNVSITNSGEKDEIREYVPAYELPDDYWYDG